MKDLKYSQDSKVYIVVVVVKTLFTHANPVNPSWFPQGACNKKVQEYLQKLITKDNIN
jgi:hypothetical protein